MAVQVSDVVSTMKTLRGPIRFEYIVAYMITKRPEIAENAHISVHYALRDAVRAGLIKKAPGGMYSYIAPKENGSVGDDVNTSETAPVVPDDKPDPSLANKRTQGDDQGDGVNREKQKTEQANNSAGLKAPPTTLSRWFTSIRNHFSYSDPKNTTEKKTAHKEEPFSVEEESLPGSSGTDDFKNTLKKKVVPKNKRYPAGKQSLVKLPGMVNLDLKKPLNMKVDGTKVRPPAGRANGNLKNVPMKNRKNNKSSGETNSLPVLPSTSTEHAKNFPIKKVARKRQRPPCENDALTLSGDSKVAANKKVIRKRKRSPAGKKALAGLPDPAKNVKNPPKKRAIRTKKRTAAGQIALTGLSGTSIHDCKKEVDRKKNDCLAGTEDLKNTHKKEVVRKQK